MCAITASVFVIYLLITEGVNPTNDIGEMIASAGLMFPIISLVLIWVSTVKLFSFISESCCIGIKHKWNDNKCEHCGRNRNNYKSYNPCTISCNHDDWYVIDMTDASQADMHNQNYTYTVKKCNKCGKTI
jgi:hypothetical protein